MPASVSHRTSRGAGWPYVLSAPREISAIRARVDARKPGSASPLPWCGTFSTSAVRSTPSRTRRASAAAPRSPVSRMRSPLTVTRTTRDRSFGSSPTAARSGLGASTASSTPPTRRRSPAVSSDRVPEVPRSTASSEADLSSSGASGPVATIPTFRPVSAPARPPTWSASRWLRSTSGSSSMPRRSRQRSTGPTSGPASTSTPAPGAVGRTRASPCPTSQATRTVSSTGQPRVAWRSGQPTRTAATSATSTRARTRAERHRTATAVSRSTPSATAPTAPPGQPTAASGSPAARSATRTSQRTGHPATHTTRSAAGGHTGASTAAPRPSTVATGTAGAASRLAGMDTRLTVPFRPATRGAVARPAAPLTARASATGAGQPRSRSRRDQPGASSTIAAVAVTDKANPGSCARDGWSRSSTVAAAASAGTAARGRPVARAHSVTAPMAAARTTLADGRARTTKPMSPSSATAACTRRSTARRRSGHNTAASTIATLAPDTAVRCARPALRKSSSRTGSLRLRSPTTSPGSRPAGGGGSTLAADSPSASRTRPAADCHQAGGATADGGSRAETTATTVSPGRGAATDTRALTRCPGKSSCQPSTGANSSAAARTGRILCSSTSPTTVASATPRGTAPPPRTRRSPSSSRTTSAPPPITWGVRSGDASRCQPCTAPVAAATAAAARTTRTAVAAGPLPRRAIPAANTAQAPAATPRSLGDSHGAANVTTQTQVAAGTRRRSTHVRRCQPSAGARSVRITGSRRRPARRRWWARCRGRRARRRSAGRGRAASGGRRSAAPARGRCRAGRRAR